MLEHQDPVRYKLQRFDSDGRWKDVSKYSPVYASPLEPLINLDLARAKNFSVEDFDYAAEAEPARFRYALRRILSQVAVTPKYRQVRTWKDYFDDIAHSSTHPNVLFLKTTLQLLSTILEQGVNDEPRLNAIGSALTAIKAEQHRYLTTPEQIAYSLQEGKLMSFMDRDAAAEAFRHAISHDSLGLINDFYIDMGAYTYFGTKDQPNSPLVSDIQQSIKPLRWTVPVNPLATVVSVDPHFFRIYAPQLYMFAQHLPDIDMVILLCGDDDEVTKALHDGEQYLAHLVHLNQSGMPHNIQYLHAPVPPSVAQPKTFYACARFFAADQLLQRYERVYLMDADLTVEDNPMPYFERIKNITFGSATNHDLTTLSPWRRNLAGNVALRGEVALEQILPDLLPYLARGLAMNNSWMLDQNALAFAAERHSQVYTSLEGFKRPFRQLQFRSTWEKQHFASSPEPPTGLSGIR